MSTPTPQEIRDRLAKVEELISDTWGNITVRSAMHTAMFADAKTNVLHAAALTLLVEQQRTANQLATAQVWATMGEHRAAREILQEIGDV